MNLTITLTNKVVITLVFLLMSLNSSAQLGFCSGNSGDPIFTEDFGVAPSSALQNIQLTSGTTTYNYLGATVFGDGKYIVSNSTDYWNWFDESGYSFQDHTPNDTNGRMLIVNASFDAGEFFSLPVNGLCENTTYEFSSWLVNLTPRDLLVNGSLPNPCNVSFEIWDSLDTTQLASGSTGDFLGSLSTETGEWIQSALVFQTLPGQTSVILKMVNNGVGGYGNDLAIDDIVFKSCGDFISINDDVSNDNITICSSQVPYTTTLMVTPDFSVFSTHFYQWQESLDGVTWTDLPGETLATITVTGINATTYFRSKVAESIINLNNSLCNTVSDIFQVTVNPAPIQPTIECWEIATFDDASCNWNITGSQPAQPSLECWETATFNATTCSWDIAGIQSTQPTLECWETALFNSATCSWQVSGTQSIEPSGLECWETATFNTTTCNWDISGIQPTQPTLECWETALFNSTTCSWDVSGTQSVEPLGLECWESATFNTTTCSWDISGIQPTQPTLECWETALFNNTTCSWDISGTQPAQPSLECWESATFNTTSCSWDIIGTQPAQPSLECSETATFNTTTCSWDVSETPPTQPPLECWETALFNSSTCSWDVSGTQPAEPSGLECWEIATFNDAICDWEITGTQSTEPTLECWEMATFNTTICNWEITGTQPVEPTNLECWETATFDSTTCSWDISGVEPLAPTDLECWESTTFNTTTCLWEITGTQIINFIEEYVTICNGEDVYLQANTEINNATYQWDSGEITSSIVVNTSGTYSVVSTDGCSTIEKTIYVEVQESPIIESVQSDGSSIVVLTSNSGDFLYSLDNINFQINPVFSNVEGGKYNIYVKSYECDNTVFVPHLHFYIPKYFTPNNDGKNDTFNLSGIEYFESSEVYIFNRYGKLLFSAVNSNVDWEGTYENEALPVSDYWYSIIIEDQEFKGHFTLKR